MTRTLIDPGLEGSPAPRRKPRRIATDPMALVVDLADTAQPVPTVREADPALMIAHLPDWVHVGHSPGAALLFPTETTESDRIGQVRPIAGWPCGKPAKVAASRNGPGSGGKWLRDALPGEGDRRSGVAGKLQESRA